MPLSGFPMANFHVKAPAPERVSAGADTALPNPPLQEIWENMPQQGDALNEAS
jgi:hypothetical protein